MRPNWFIGLPVPPDGWHDELIASAPDGLRLFAPEDLHVTVAFLGGCGEERASAAWAEATRVEPRTIEARLGRLAAFGNPRRPSALAVKVEEAEAFLRPLLGVRGDAMRQAAGLQPEGREPRAHVTVARVPRRADRGLRDEAKAWIEEREPVDQPVSLERLALYTWAADRRQRQFRLVEEIELR